MGGIVYRIGRSEFSWMNGKHIESHQMLGQRPYCLHLCHLSESNVSGVNPRLPYRTQLDSCLGIDQVIVSTIENEKNNIYSIGDIAAFWTDTCNKFFIDEAVTAFFTQWSTVLHQKN